MVVSRAWVLSLSNNSLFPTPMIHAYRLMSDISFKMTLKFSSSTSPKSFTVLQEFHPEYFEKHKI